MTAATMERDMGVQQCASRQSDGGAGTPTLRRPSLAYRREGLLGCAEFVLLLTHFGTYAGSMY